VPYLCPAGKRTIGWGHVIVPTDTFTTPIGEQMAEHILQLDLMRFERCVLSCQTDLTQDQFDAMVCVAFNIGTEAFLMSSMARCLRVKDFGNVTKYLKQWNKATVKGRLVVLDGLVKRRRTEAELFDTGTVTFYN
jgi:lysozyme